MRDSNFVFVDGNYLLIRSFFGALNNPYTDDLIRYGWSIILHKICNIAQKYGTQKIFMVMDGRRTHIRRFRHGGYKAGRQPLPVHFLEAYRKASAIFNAMGVRVLKRDELEADDVIASLVTHLKDDVRGKILIFSEDADLYPLLDSNVVMLKYNLDEISMQSVLDRFRIERIDQLEFLYSLAGDSSDGLPGVRGVGIKTAHKLLARYGTLQSLMKEALAMDVGNPKSDRLLLKVHLGWRDLLITKIFRKLMHVHLVKEKVICESEHCFDNLEAIRVFCDENNLGSILDRVVNFIEDVDQGGGE